jgi:hypothetical protein
MNYSDLINDSQQNCKDCKNTKIWDAVKKLQDFIDSYYKIAQKDKKEANDILIAQVLINLQKHKS